MPAKATTPWPRRAGPSPKPQYVGWSTRRLARTRPCAFYGPQRPYLIGSERLPPLVLAPLGPQAQQDRQSGRGFFQPADDRSCVRHPSRGRCCVASCARRPSCPLGRNALRGPRRPARAGLSDHSPCISIWRGRLSCHCAEYFRCRRRHKNSASLPQAKNINHY